MAFGPSASALPVDDRAAAMEVLAQESSVERTFSNCRWIRRTRDDAGRDRWRKANREVVSAARSVIDAQGGLTAPRRKVIDDLAGVQSPDPSENPAACKAFFAEAAEGKHDLTTRVPGHVLGRVFSAPNGQSSGIMWIMEQRRQATGVLAWSAKPYEGDGDMFDCEAQGARKGHVSFRRQRYDENMIPLQDADSDLWLAECLISPVNPVTGAPPPPAKPDGT